MTIPMRGVGQTKRRKPTSGDHRCTPKVIWKAALRGIGRTMFDLDPATNPHATVPARTQFMGLEVDGMCGLTEPWFGNTFLNFPFSFPPPWIAKLQAEVHRTRSITIVGPDDASVGWHQELTSFADAKADWPRRLHFATPEHEKGSPPAPISLWYVGPQSNGWRRVMTEAGCITSAGDITRPRALHLRVPKHPPPLPDLG